MIYKVFTFEHIFVDGIFTLKWNQKAKLVCETDFVHLSRPHLETEVV